MSVVSIQLKKPEIIYQENNIPQARNPIYQRPIRVKCPYCSGKKKVFKTLYSLYYHFREEHEYEYDFKNYTISLADKIIQGESI